ncbi:penicillin-binding protein [Convivina praedatoris]|uniref:Penicillin-binding protein 2B n=1 Tax=Convivina praedatoris TaxID=2880963 RepID=A0ABN8HCE0_9LACO|nr:penicillin-binding protein [Convivina sp. LMG 32447]CAH1854331.1 Penicillin-binding protein 2B [Convivina sp. LMG 32447]CAH1855564.1 Penicillin-binding protein 2B [Convivina sp. LMG 32447]CAH1855650.1 Penicillin-binding protein 2B [Convivina sp. LMG 32447]
MSKKIKRLSNRRVSKNAKFFGFFLLIATGLLILIMGLRLLQIATLKRVNSHNLTTATRQAFMQEQMVTATRGRVFSTDGEVLADNSTVYDLYAVLDKNQFDGKKPKYVQDKKETAKKLSSVIDLSEDDILKRLDSNKLQVEFGTAGKGLDIDQYNKIKAMKLAGVGFIPQPARYYPNNRMASHIIGLTNSITNAFGKNTLNGILGIEDTRNKSLKGKDGVKDYLGNQVSQGQNQVKNGDNVTLTLDEKLQTTLENRMDVMFDGTKAKSAMAVLMDSKTGKILAATQRPNFDPNSQDGLKDNWVNLLNQSTFEPGSTMKTITLAAAIQEGKWHPNDTYQSGSLNIDGGRIVDAFGQNEGVLTYREGYWRSSNVAFAHVEQALGATIWKKYIDRFHFLEPTHSDLPNEASGSISFQQAIDQANTAYGQAINVTTLQLLQAYSAIANNGKEVKPYLVEKVTDSKTGKTLYQGKTTTVGQPITAATAKEVRKYMTDVVNQETGTAKQYDLRDAGYQISAKTGTAQISENGRYLDGLNNDIHSVMTIVPEENPRFIMYVAVRQPKVFPDPNIQLTLNKVFRPVMLQALNDSKSAVKSKTNEVKLPQVTGQSIDDARSNLEKVGLRVAVVGSTGRVKTQSVSAGSYALKDQLIILKANGKTLLPNMNGWSLTEAQRYANETGFNLKSDGTGFITKQSMDAGQEVNGQSVVSVELKEKE